ncbi:MAG: hypothetical protein IPJ07_14460 [Acidobacteria bacterium]|nr:hypothetical protein [Acidobacteriota bacterium]
MSDEKEENNSLIKADDHGLTTRSNSLARRGLEQIQRSKKRVLHFPNNVSLGILYFKEQDWCHYLSGEPLSSGICKNPIGEATGTIELSRDQFIYLKLTKEGLKHIYALTRLKPDDIDGIGFENENVDDSALSYISKLTGLKYIGLSYSKISDFSITTIRSLNNLIEINLCGTKVTDEGLRHLSNLKQLQVLDLSSTQITDEGLRHLSNLKQLQSLKLQSDVWIIKQRLLYTIQVLPVKDCVIYPN